MKINLEESENKYIMKIDASSYRESNCMRRMYYILVRGLRYAEKNFKMEYGTAYHKALQEYYTTGDTNKAIHVAMNHYSNDDIIIPEKDWRDIGHLGACITQYFQHYETDGLVPDKDDNGNPMLEMRFAYPIYTDTNLDILLCGTVDFIGKYHGHPVICDHKTTSLSQIQNYLDGYRLSTQLMMYHMVMKKLMPKKHYECVINGIFLNRTGKNKFQRSALISFLDEHMKTFEKHFIDTVKNIAHNFNNMLNNGLSDSFIQNFNACDSKYGHCKFLPVCSVNKNFMENIIEIEYDEKRYDPLLFQA
tara:strand:- start:1620 stop:2534 length:915 start_codon:yes stop_codon:yes gene_type:complete